jgi:hypothetical protein
MAKGNTSTAKGKATARTKAPLKKPAPKKAPPKKGSTKNKRPQKRAAEDESSEDESEESDHRPRKRKRSKRDGSDSEIVDEIHDGPEEELETVTVGTERAATDSESEVRISQLICQRKC